MDWHLSRTARAASRMVCAFVGIALAVTISGIGYAQAQSAPAGSAEATHQGEIYRTFHLTNIAEPHQLIELRGDLHAMIPGATIIDMPRQQAISMRGTPEELETAQKIIADLDQPYKEVRQTFFLANITEQRELNDVQTDLRNLFPELRVYGVASDRAISLEGTSEDVEAAHTVIAELDRPSKTYRITYSLTEFDNGNRAGEQKDVLIAAAGQKTTFTEGTKVPVMTGMPGKPDAPAQFQYIDVGLKIEALPESSANGLRLKTHVEQSSVAGEKMFGGVQEPTLSQTVLDGTANLTDGKPQALGSLDIPGTTKRLEIAVEAEAVK